MLTLLSIALALVAAVMGLMYYKTSRETSDLRTALSWQQKHLNELEKEIAKSAELTVNDIPVKYDAGSKTVCVEGNLVASGFIACGSTNPNSNA